MKIDREIYRELKILCRYMRRKAHPVNTKEGDLSHSQLSFLNIIAKYPEINQKQLGEIMNIRPSYIAENLGKLEDLGLIYKVKDKKDKRINLLFISKLGEEKLEYFFFFFENMENGLFNILNEEEKECLFKIVNKINNSLEEKPE